MATLTLGTGLHLWNVGLSRPKVKSSTLNEEELRQAIEAIFSRPPLLQWYCNKVELGALDSKSAAIDFFERSSVNDISPVRFFDPVWFRAQYRVSGVNAFLSYLRDGRQRLAWPSPLFAARWYCRRYGLIGSSANPFLDFLLSGDERSPHPLLDVKFLRDQASSWRSGAVALEFLDDVEKHRLKPHPLFDGNWYLDKNPDVAAAGVNPLEHYLYFGHAE